MRFQLILFKPIGKVPKPENWKDYFVGYDQEVKNRFQLILFKPIGKVHQ